MIKVSPKNSITLICMFFLCFLTTTLNAQTKTAYEKRKEEISLQLFKNLGISLSEISRAKNIGGIEGLFMFNGIMKKLSTMEGLILMERYSTALKNAESLKTEVDFKKERLKKEEEDKKKQLAQDALDEKKRQEQLDKQKEEQEQRYNNSDYISIKKGIKAAFENWLKKGEFEKTELYKDRIINKNLAFDSICNKIITNQIDGQVSYFSAKVELLTYNADNEYYPIKIILKDKFILDTLKIKLDDAMELKERSQGSRIGSLLEGEENWCLIENYLFPLKIRINYLNKDIKVPYIEKYTLLNFTSNELNLTNYDQEELKYVSENYEAKRDRLIKEINTKKYNEIILTAEQSMSKGSYFKALKFYQKASHFEQNPELLIKIANLKEKTKTIEKKYNEMHQIEYFIKSNYQVQITKSQELGLILVDKNKKANANFNSIISMIQSKYKATDNTVNIIIDKESDNWIWTSNEEKTYSTLIEKEKIIRTWLEFNKAVFSLIENKELKILKSEENPELVLQKVLTAI